MNMAEATIVEHDGGLAAALGHQQLTIDPEVVHARPALRGYVGRKVAAGMRSEDLTEAGPQADAPPDRRLRSTALLTEALGSEIVVHFEVPAHAVETEQTKELDIDSGMDELQQSIEIAGTKFVASFSPRTRVRVGDAVEIVIDTSRMHFFDLETGLAISD